MNNLKSNIIYFFSNIENLIVCVLETKSMYALSTKVFIYDIYLVIFVCKMLNKRRN